MPPEKVLCGGAPAEVPVAKDQKVGIRREGGEEKVRPPSLLRSAAEEARQAPDEGRRGHPGLFLFFGAGEAILSQHGGTAIVCLPEGRGGKGNDPSSRLSVEGILRPFCRRVKPGERYARPDPVSRPSGRGFPATGKKEMAAPSLTSRSDRQRTRPLLIIRERSGGVLDDLAVFEGDPDVPESVGSDPQGDGREGVLVAGIIFAAFGGDGAGGDLHGLARSGVDHPEV